MSQIKVVSGSLAICAIALVSASPAGAAQTTASYNVARGLCSKPIAIPANNKPIILAGTNLESIDPGEGHVTLLHVPGRGGFLSWEGSDSAQGFTHGGGTTVGLTVMYLDGSGYVAVETNGPSSVIVCNSPSNSSNAFGYLTFFY